MNNTGKLKGLTLFITGASRGIGKAIAVKAGKDGANVVIAAKTAEPHPKLAGTIFTAAKEVEEAGGKALPVVCDIRSEEQVQSAVKQAIEKFGGIDILINNASAINHKPVGETDMKRYDLMQSINARGTFMVTKECLPYLKKSNHAHVLIMSPPLQMDPKILSNKVAYIISKYGMSMCALGMAEEFKPFNIGVNTLWPKTLIWTAAVDFMWGDVKEVARTDEIMADSAYAILTRDPKKCSGNFYIDEEILKEEGITDFTRYACNPEKANEQFVIYNAKL